MKIRILQRLLARNVLAGACLVAFNMAAQDASTAQTANVAPPQMPYDVSQVIKLEQAKIGDSTIIAYINNTGQSYKLDANQILYLRQQGVSDAVITAMLKQPKTAVTQVPAVSPTTVPPAVPTVAATQTTPLYSPRQQQMQSQAGAPTVTYIQTVPAPTYYYQPYPYYYPYYYPGYAWYPPVSVSFGWGWGWRGGWYR